MTRLFSLCAVSCLLSTALAWGDVDLVPRLRSYRITHQTFTSTSGDVRDECIPPGTYKLLRFDTLAQNYGSTHLDIGRPGDRPDLFVWSSSHGHYHFEGFLNYALFNMAGQQVKPGFKQAFCLEDIEQLIAGKPSNGYTCDYQGISSGWTDVYVSSLPCQFLDVTGLPDADYTITVDCNPERKIVEGSYANNTFTARLRIQGDTVTVVATATPTSTSTGTATPTNTPTATPTMRPSSTATATARPTPTSTATSTATSTPSPTSRPTATVTSRPTATATSRPRATPTTGAAAWQPNTFYAAGAVVTYNNATYRCIQAHTSQVGWEPPNVPALWAVQ